MGGARPIAILLLAAALAAGGCGSGASEVEPLEGSAAAARKASAGPLSALVGRLEAEDDATEGRERAEEAPESAQEREEGREEQQQEAARRREGEEKAIEEEAQVGANGATSS
jgi:hypothetical protein